MLVYHSRQRFHEHSDFSILELVVGCEEKDFVLSSNQKENERPISGPRVEHMNLLHKKTYTYNKASVLFEIRISWILEPRL